MRPTAKDGDRMPFLVKVAGKDVPNLTCTSGNDDLHCGTSSRYASGEGR